MMDGLYYIIGFGYYGNTALGVLPVSHMQEV